MLQSINDKFKGWVTWIIIIVVGAVFVLTGISYFFVSGGVSPQAVAKVGDAQISENSYRQMLQQNTSASGGDQKALAKKTLNQLVDQALLQQDAKNSGVSITQGAVSSAIFANPAFQDNGKYSAKKFDEIAQYYGGAGAIKSMIASNLLTSSILNPVIGSGFVLPAEQTAYNALEKQKRVIHYYTFDAKDYEKNVDVSDKALKAYYQSHKERYHVPEAAVISYVSLASTQFAQPDKVTTADIQSYYNQNKAFLTTAEMRSGVVVTIKKEAKDKDAIIAALKKGERLSPAEKKELTEKPIQNMTAQDAKSYSEFILFQLTKASPVKELTENEYVVLKTISAPKPMSLEEASPVVRKILANRAAREKFNEVLTSMNNTQFKQVVSDNKLKVEKSKAFSMGDSSYGVEGNAKLQQSIFEHDKKQGFVTQGQSSGIIYRVDNINPAHTLAFEDVKEKVKKAYVVEQSLALAKKEAQQVKGELNAGKTPSDLSKGQNKTISRDDNLPEAILTAVFKAPKGQYEVVRDKEAFWVFSLTKVIKGKPSNQNTQALQNNYATIEANDYVQALHHEIPVEINQHILQTNG